MRGPGQRASIFRGRALSTAFAGSVGAESSQRITSLTFTLCVMGGGTTSTTPSQCASPRKHQHSSRCTSERWQEREPLRENFGGWFLRRCVGTITGMTRDEMLDDLPLLESIATKCDGSRAAV
jgi:hypothetical protein